MNLNAFRRNWLKLQKAYERKAFKITKSAFKDIANNIPFDKMTKDTYIMYLEASVSEDDILKMYTEIYYQIGVAHGLVMGKTINKEIKEFTPGTFIQDYQKGLSEWVLKYAGYRITSVRNSYVEYIKNIIATGIEENKTIVEITKEIKKLIKSPSFYRWQAMRIARTETTAAANRGAVQAGNNSNLVYEKVWVSANDSRVRTMPESDYDHREMNGKRVDKDKPFNVNGELIMYAGALETVYGTPSHGQNVINCRCANVIVAKRDSNGRLIRL